MTDDNPKILIFDRQLSILLIDKKSTKKISNYLKNSNIQRKNLKKKILNLFGWVVCKILDYFNQNRFFFRTKEGKY